VTCQEVLAEARRLSAGLTSAGVRARFIGGVGVALRATSPIPSALRRDYGDLDLVVDRRQGPALAAALPGLGYAPSRRFNAVHGRRRMLFEDEARQRRLDVFVGDFAMCHALSFDGRLPAGHPAAFPSDLLLTKLQIVKINLKDLRDTVVLLLSHDFDTFAEVGAATAADRVIEVTRGDWGWYTTVTDNLGQLREHAAGAADLAEHNEIIQAKISKLAGQLEASPKPLRWRTRARLGRRATWYEEPDEVG
jgi:hypothetical protein